MSASGTQFGTGVRDLRLTLGLAGLFLSGYIQLQKANGFNRGCWGIGAVGTAAEAAGCKSAVLAAASTVWGMPIAAGGAALFLLFVARDLFPAAFRPAASVLCVKGALLFGAGATLGLINVQRQAGAWCPLCLFLASIIAILCALHLPGLSSKLAPSSRVARFWASGAFASLLASVGFGFIHLGTRDAVMLFASPRNLIIPAFGRTVDTSGMLQRPGAMDASHGKLLVETFLDPNCPHCREAFSALTKLAETHSSYLTIKVYYRPVFDYSLTQCALLEVALQDGIYYKVWEALLEHQIGEQGSSLGSMATIYQQAGGKSGDLMKRLTFQLARVREATRQVAELGIFRTPTILVDRRELAESQSASADIMYDVLARYANVTSPTSSPP
ncbi:MAG: hypothetical protein RL324_1392 [Verrucomicrobiota bacterium]|jgi:uncharacterized membrane protein